MVISDNMYYKILECQLYTNSLRFFAKFQENFNLCNFQRIFAKKAAENANSLFASGGMNEHFIRRREELEKLVGASKPAGHQTARAASFYLDAASDLDRIMAELWRLDQERKP